MGSWERQGVAQFRQAHYMQPGGRHVLGSELPDVVEALKEAGAAELAWGRMLPPTITDRSPRPIDEMLTTVTARRPTLEQAMASAADRQDGLTVRRGDKGGGFVLAPEAGPRGWRRVSATASADRARMDQLLAARDGGPYVVPADPGSRLRAALPLAMGVDAEAFRAGMEIVGCLALPGEVFSRPGMAERVMKAAATRGDFRLPGPGRAELLELVSSAGAPAATG